MDCFDSNLGNNFENNIEKLQEILNRIIQGIMSIIILLPQHYPEGGVSQHVPKLRCSNSSYAKALSLR